MNKVEKIINDKLEFIVPVERTGGEGFYKWRSPNTDGLMYHWDKVGDVGWMTVEDWESLQNDKKACINFKQFKSEGNYEIKCV